MLAIRNTFFAVLFAVSAGCAQLGIPTATTFNERLTAAYALNTEVRTTSVTLLNAKKINSDDAQNILDQNNTARAGLDVARTIGKANPEAGDTKLVAVRTVLLALQAYLATKEKN
jgi:hypothetical protein